LVKKYYLYHLPRDPDVLIRFVKSNYRTTKTNHYAVHETAFFKKQIELCVLVLLQIFYFIM